MLISEKIILFITSWTIFILFLTGDSNLEIFLVLMLIGMLIAREFTDRYTTIHIRNRLNIFILIFILMFIVFVAKKILDIFAFTAVN